MLRLHIFKIVVLLSGITLSVVLSYFIHNWERTLIKTEFERLASSHVANIRKEMERHVDLVASVRGLFTASKSVERREFKDFVAGNVALHADVQLIAWAPRITEDQRAATEAAARRDGLTNYRVTELNAEGRVVTAGERPWYFPVYFMEPTEPNPRLFGYDIASDPQLWRDLARARDNGEIITGQKIVFDRRGEEQYGLMLIEPIYASHEEIATVEQRRAALRGFVLQVFRIGSMVTESLTGSGIRGIDIWVYDQKDEGGTHFLHHYHGDPSSIHDGERHELTPPQSAPLLWRTTVDVTGMHWALVFVPTPAYLAAHQVWRSWTALAVGIFLTVLLYLYLKVMADRAVRIESLAMGLTRTNTELEREVSSRRAAEARLAEAQHIAHLGSWELDLTTNALEWSDEIYRIFELNPAEFGASYEAFLARVHPEDREMVDRGYRESVQNKTPYDLVHRLLFADGRIKYVHERCHTYYDADGNPVRSLGTVEDVTERRVAEIALQQEIRERRHIETAIAEVVEAVSSSTGDEFFRMLVKRLTEALHMDFAFISEIPEEHPEVAVTVAVCAHGEIVENFRYDLEGTPCKHVCQGRLREQKSCFYPRGVRELFPSDAILAEMEVESYLGIPLFNTSGKAMGIVGVMSCAAVENRQPAEAMLQVYATRIAAELQHRKAQAQILDLAKYPDENPSPVIRVRTDGVVLYANPGSEPLLACWDCRVGGTIPGPVIEQCRRALHSGEVVEVDMGCGAATYSLLLAPSKESGYVNLYGRDVTERLRADAQMRKLSGALEQTADAVMITDVHGVIEYVNPAFESMTGYRTEEVLGRNPNLLKSGRHESAFYRRLWDAITRGEVFQDIFINRKKDGTLYYEEKTLTPVKDPQGGVTHFIANGKDITDRMQAEERLHRLAYHDVLTDLPNRALFLERLEHAQTHRRDGANRLAVLFIDLDRFKNINDTLGHDVGDRLLQSLPERLGRCMRKGDTIARFGGDEFAILLEDGVSEEAAAQVAGKILEVMSQPFLIDGHELFVSTSIGISLYPDDSQDTNTLLKHADVAMYRAKDLGRNTYQFYSKDMSVKAFERLSLETSLRRALEREEFALYYQPQVEIAGGTVIGMEALLRWRHPEFGTVNPIKFVPLLEDTGLIVPVGEWILRSVCEQMRRWQREQGQLMRVAVNLSGRQFHDPELKSRVNAIVGQTGVNPALLEFEITESVLMQNDRASMDNLDALLELGARLSIDDFGTGYSSLSYLRRFPVQTLKIDRSFIHDLSHDQDDATIVAAIIAMAHSLKLSVIAEGVETEAQLSFLRQARCDAVQGYLFSPPVPVEEMTRLLGEGQELKLRSGSAA